ELTRLTIVTATTATTTTTLATVANSAAAVRPAPRRRAARSIGFRTQAKIAARTTGALRIGMSTAWAATQSNARTTSVRQLTWPSRSSHAGTTPGAVGAVAFRDSLPRTRVTAGANAMIAASTGTAANSPIIPKKGPTIASAIRARPG